MSLKAEQLREEQKRELAAVLTAELQSILDAVRFRISLIEDLKATGKSGGSLLKIRALSELYTANLSRIGILGVATVKDVIAVYKTAETMPSKITLERGHPGTKIENYDDFHCDPNSSECDSILENHVSLTALIDEALKKLLTILKR